uniref:Small ribosomal subunit protein mS31 n=1 Tax=Trichobilharzia regenti TaxID=157069 RepID=A0AA85JDT5_TRIRE|nr:unnamed protein product [Trichobilharzia regenti]
MVTYFLGVSHKFHVRCDYFKRLFVLQPLRTAQTKRLKELSSEDPNCSEKSTDVIKSKDLLSSFIKGGKKAKSQSHSERHSEMLTTAMSSFVNLPQPIDLKLFDVEHLTSGDAYISLNPVFDTVESLEASLISTACPSNQFEEWLKWTIEKKMWNFPINNEQDWLEESNVPFHEHVFLEDHLNKEHLKCKPLASFLELVCNGLSQNPHITVTEKRQHLDWFSKFFDDKISRINASVRHEEYMTDLEKVSKTNSP